MGYLSLGDEVVTCNADARFGKSCVWKGCDEALRPNWLDRPDYDADARYDGEYIWLGSEKEGSYAADGRYADGCVWLGADENFTPQFLNRAEHKAVMRYRDGKIWLGNEEGYESSPDACYEAEDGDSDIDLDGGVAAAFLLFYDKFQEAEVQEKEDDEEEGDDRESDSGSDNDSSDYYSDTSTYQPGGNSSSSSAEPGFLTVLIWVVIILGFIASQIKYEGHPMLPYLAQNLGLKEKDKYDTWQTALPINITEGGNQNFSISRDMFLMIGEIGFLKLDYQGDRDKLTTATLTSPSSDNRYQILVTCGSNCDESWLIDRWRKAMVKVYLKDSGATQGAAWSPDGKYAVIRWPFWTKGIKLLNTETLNVTELPEGFLKKVTSHDTFYHMTSVKWDNGILELKGDQLTALWNYSSKKSGTAVMRFKVPSLEVISFSLVPK